MKCVCIEMCIYIYITFMFHVFILFVFFFIIYMFIKHIWLGRDFYCSIFIVFSIKQNTILQCKQSLKSIYLKSGHISVSVL